MRSRTLTAGRWRSSATTPSWSPSAARRRASTRAWHGSCSRSTSAAAWSRSPLRIANRASVSSTRCRSGNASRRRSRRRACCRMSAARPSSPAMCWTRASASIGSNAACTYPCLAPSAHARSRSLRAASSRLRSRCTTPRTYRGVIVNQNSGSATWRDASSASLENASASASRPSASAISPNTPGTATRSVAWCGSARADELEQRLPRARGPAHQRLQLRLCARRAELVPRPLRAIEQLARALSLARGLEQVAVREVDEELEVGPPGDRVDVAVVPVAAAVRDEPGIDELAPVARAFDIAHVAERQRHVEGLSDVDRDVRAGQHLGPLRDRGDGAVEEPGQRPPPEAAPRFLDLARPRPSGAARGPRCRAVRRRPRPHGAARSSDRVACGAAPSARSRGTAGDSGSDRRRALRSARCAGPDR